MMPVTMPNVRPMTALMAKISRTAYAEMYGPTTGDRVRLGDTGLWIEVEADRTVYGEEVKFGGGVSDTSLDSAIAYLYLSYRFPL